MPDILNLPLNLQLPLPRYSNSSLKEPNSLSPVSGFDNFYYAQGLSVLNGNERSLLGKRKNLYEECKIHSLKFQGGLSIGKIARLEYASPTCCAATGGRCRTRSKLEKHQKFATSQYRKTSDQAPDSPSRTFSCCSRLRQTSNFAFKKLKLQEFSVNSDTHRVHTWCRTYQKQPVPLLHRPIVARRGQHAGSRHLRRVARPTRVQRPGSRLR